MKLTIKIKLILTWLFGLFSPIICLILLNSLLNEKVTLSYFNIPLVIIIILVLTFLGLGIYLSFILFKKDSDYKSIIFKSDFILLKNENIDIINNTVLKIFTRIISYFLFPVILGLFVSIGKMNINYFYIMSMISIICIIISFPRYNNIVNRGKK
jgi:hypothetical protein